MKGGKGYKSCNLTKDFVGRQIFPPTMLFYSYLKKQNKKMLQLKFSTLKKLKTLLDRIILVVLTLIAFGKYDYLSFSLYLYFDATGS